MALSPLTAPMCFILSPPYHGAGMLSWRMNHHQEILSLGTCNPLRNESQVCSCGETVANCPFWSKVHDDLGTSEEDPIPTLLPQAPYLTRRERLNIWLNGTLALMSNEVTPKCWKMVYEQAERFFGKHDKFLTTCRTQYPHKIFIDGERSNIKFMVMASMGFPVKGVIHLVRDPRAYVAIWKKYYPESPVEKPTLEWLAAHMRIRRLKHFFPRVPFLTLQYEDLLAKPQDSLDRALKFVKAGYYEPHDLKIEGYKNHLVGLGAQDTEGGMAPRTENWRESLHPDDQERVLKVAGPLFSELGYKP